MILYFWSNWTDQSIILFNAGQKIKLYVILIFLIQNRKRELTVTGDKMWMNISKYSGMRWPTGNWQRCDLRNPHLNWAPPPPLFFCIFQNYRIPSSSCPVPSLQWWILEPTFVFIRLQSKYLTKCLDSILLYLRACNTDLRFFTLNVAWPLQRAFQMYL